MIKRTITLFFILTLTLGFVFSQGKSSAGQDQRTLSTKVADILTELPAQDEGHFKKLMDETISLGEPGILLFTNMLQPPGEEDDSRVRFALNGLAKYVTGPGTEEARKLYTSSIIISLENSEDAYIKSFLISQLQIAGKKEAVPALEGLLSDDVLCEPATRALITIGSNEAEAALINALDKSYGPCQVTIVRALGEIHSVKAEETIAKLASTTDVNLRKVSLYALANIGSVKSEKILYKAARESGFQYDMTGSARSYILYINRIGEEGHLNEMERMCRALITGQPSNIRSQALTILVEFKGAEVAEDLLTAVDDDDKEFRAIALKLADKIPTEAFTGSWIKKLDAASPEIQSEIIEMLGNRGDPVALPSILLSLKHDNQNVRLASIRSSALLGKEKAIKPLLEYLPDADKEETEAIKVAFSFMEGNQLLPGISSSYDQMSTPGKVLLLEILALRNAVQYSELVRRETANSVKEVRLAAYLALSILSTAEDSELLYNLLISNDDPDEEKAIQNTLISTANRLDDAAKADLLERTVDLGKGKKAVMLEILPEIGGKTALDIVLKEYNSNDDELKLAAFNALTSWKDLDATYKLFDIFIEDEDDNYKEKSAAAYIEQVNRSRVPDEQKLLLYRKLFKNAEANGLKQEILKNIGEIKTFQSLIFAGQFINDKELQQEAAYAVMNIALPNRGRDNGMTGSITRELLQQVIKIISGEESEYDKVNIREYLTGLDDEEGFVSLFNGKDLTGWKGLVEDPISRLTMDAETLRIKQAEADKEMVNCWSVRDGAIWFNGKGANLCTVKQYGDFELLVDWKITKNGDSGIYLRGSPQVQIWDTSRTESGAQVGSGGLYNNQKNPDKPILVADNRVGEWNTFRILMIGEKVSVWLNGQLVVDNAIMENYWDRDHPIFPVEQIELQAHGTDLGFRDIYIREIPRINYNILSDEEKSSGFVQLFNGKDLQGWIGNKTDYVVEDGTIVIYPGKGGHGNLYTEREYADFNFRFEFQLTPGANNGLGIRTPLEGDAAYVGMELQILDNSAPIYRKLEQYQYHGSVYGVIPAKRGFLKPIGEWNSEEVIIKGSDIRIILNGMTIVDGNIDDASRNGTIDGNDHPGLKRKKGYIGFLGHGSIVKFRNIRIKEL